MFTSKNDFSLSQGNLYRMGKRKKIYYRFRWKREQKGRLLRGEVRRSSNTTVESVAQEVAWLDYLRANGLAPDGKPRVRLRNDYSKIGQIVDLYAANIQEHANIKPASARGNVQALLRVLKLCYPDKDPRELKADVLTRDLILDWRRRRKGIAIAMASSDNKRINYSLNSEYAKVKCIFSKASLRHILTDERLPDLTDFLEVASLDEHDTRFKPIPPAVLGQIDGALRSWPDTYGDTPTPPGAAVVVAVELARYCALRSHEIQNLRWEWLQLQASGNYNLGIFYREPDLELGIPEYEPKAREGWVPVSAALVARWRKILNDDSELGFVIPGDCPTHRVEVVERDASKWVAQFLPDRNKRLHELRKQAGAEIATRDGIYAAAQFLRDSVAVTEKHYGALTKGLKPLDPY